MSALSPFAGSGAATRLSWRAMFFWAVFAVTLLAGLVLAARFGASAPTMLDVVRP